LGDAWADNDDWKSAVEKLTREEKSCSIGEFQVK
jgi:hypothetical protein